MISPAILACAPAGGSGGYTGPLDIVPGAVVAYSQRAMAAAWVSNAITIRRDSDDATQSFATTTSNAVDQTAISAFIGGGNGFGVAWLDQSGGGQDLTDHLGVNGPAWSANVIGGRPVLVMSGSNNDVFKTPFNSPAGAYTFFVVTKFDATNGPILISIRADDGSQIATLGSFYNVAGDVYIEIGPSSTDWATTGTINSDPHIFEWVIDGAGNVTILVDGVDLVATIQSGSPQALVAAGGGGSSAFTLQNGNAADARDAEIIAWNAALSAPNRLAIRENIAAYYGITLS